MSKDPGWWDLVEFLDLEDFADGASVHESLDAQAMVDDGLSIVSIEDLMDD